MCGTCGDIALDHLDDDFSDIFGAGEPMPANVEFAKAALARAVHSPDREAVYVEPCTDCRGTGNFYSYSGRLVGKCFKCKGAGTQSFKTSPESRAAAKQARENQKIEQARRIEEKAGKWRADHIDEWHWMAEGAARGFEFAASMVQALSKYGHLTEKQLATVQRLAKQSAARKAERAAEQNALFAEAKAIDATALDKIQTAFNNAIENDVKLPKMRLDRFFFALVRTGKNAGAIYVKTIEKNDFGERTYLGKIVDGKFVRVRECSQDDAAAIVAAASDPAAAAIAYGRREGACSICGLPLTNHESIDLGIGPICRSKFGWG